VPSIVSCRPTSHAGTHERPSPVEFRRAALGQTLVAEGLPPGEEGRKTSPASSGRVKAPQRAGDRAAACRGNGTPAAPVLGQLSCIWHPRAAITPGLPRRPGPSATFAAARFFLLMAWGSVSIPRNNLGSRGAHDRAARCVPTVGPGKFSRDGRRLAGVAFSSLRTWDLGTGRLHGTAVLWHDDQAITISAQGHHSCATTQESDVVYVVQTGAGQEILSPEHFAERYGWRNDAGRAILSSTGT
jgi:hypothetical protein